MVVLNRYPELAERLIESISRTHESLPSILIVRDRNAHEYHNVNIQTIDAPEPFIFARNANIGIQLFPGRDVFLCNDDIQITEPNFFDRLHSISCKWLSCGLISSVIAGGVGNRIQDFNSISQYWEGLPEDICIGEGTVCFPCVLLKRDAINSVGLLDENLTGYGLDDDDYCLRTREKGFWTMITRQLCVNHGNGGPGISRGFNYSLSFVREPEKFSNLDYFNKKHSAQK